MKIQTTLFIVMAALSAAGCASVIVGDDAIVEPTAFALGLHSA